MSKTILILGAGVGGIITAQELRKKLRNKGNSNTKIMVFEKEENHVFAPSLLWLMVGKRKPKQVYRSTRKIQRKGIEVVIGEIEKVNPEKITITVGGKEYKGDFMVVSLGVEQLPEHNLNSYGFDFYTLEGATKFNEQLQNFKGGRIAVLVPSLPFKCPAAPYEAAMLIESFIRKRGLRERTEISLYTPEPGPLSVAGKELSGMVKQMVEAKGIKYFPSHQLTAAKDESLTFENGVIANFDLLAFTPKHQCPSVVRGTSLIGKSGWIEVDRYTLETTFQNVYALGDVTSIPLEVGKPLPKAGVFAHYQAETVAHNIAQQITGDIPDKIFNGEGQCFLETGGGKAGYAGGNFYASPAPAIKMKRPGNFSHWKKVLFEKYWFIKNF